MILFSKSTSAISLDELRKIGFEVTVRLREEPAPLRVCFGADYVIRDGAGRECLRLKKLDIIRFDIEPDKTAKSAAKSASAKPCSVVIGIFDQTRKTAARALAAQARRVLGMETRVGRLPPGAKLAAVEDKPYGALAVCVGVFDTPAEAAQTLDKARSAFPLARIAYPIPETVAHPAIRISGGEKPLTVAVVPGPLEIAPLNPQETNARLLIGAVRPEARDWRLGYHLDILCPGKLMIATDAQGNLLAINQMAVEDYLRGVVPAEMGKAPLEALQAQAVASRSEALARVDSCRYPNPLYDLCATWRTQVFVGLKAAAPLSDQAIRETAGAVMMYNGQVAETSFSANCGGITANSEDLWDCAPIPYLRARVDGPSQKKPDLKTSEAVYRWLASWPDVFSNPIGCQAIPPEEIRYFRWRQTIPASTLERLIRARKDIGVIQDARVVERSETGRVRAFEFIGGKGSLKVAGCMEIRAVLDEALSTFFILLPERDSDGKLISLTLYGAGYGHGVGLCQTGARRMASEGRSVSEIMKHYYPAAALVQI
ncbi:MAG: SpoIID/LytB domain-containing protein [Candidatus Sumerlaeota bacterium]|nr:SpoIID/LytB domain-containing protein [Candidatus Sumerlaeota bacterium]